jgi:hypothetical protein
MAGATAVLGQNRAADMLTTLALETLRIRLFQ